MHVGALIQQLKKLILISFYLWNTGLIMNFFKLSKPDGKDGRAVAFHPADPGSNPRSGSIFDRLLSVTRIDGYVTNNK